MKNIRRFANQTEFNTYKNSNSYIEPHTSLTDNVGLSYNVQFPKVRILTKVAEDGYYRYTTTPGLFSLLPDIYNTSYTYSVYFNGILYTNNAKLFYVHSYADLGHSYLRMSSNTNNELYNHYFYAQTDDLGASNMYAILPDSFGEVGDEITVRLFKN